jgi:hypothetical protein
MIVWVLQPWRDELWCFRWSSIVWKGDKCSKFQVRAGLCFTYVDVLKVLQCCHFADTCVIMVFVIHFSFDNNSEYAMSMLIKWVIYFCFVCSYMTWYSYSFIQYSRDRPKFSSCIVCLTYTLISHTFFSQAYWSIKSLINDESERLIYDVRTNYSSMECPNFDNIYFLFNMYVIFSNPPI